MAKWHPAHGLHRGFPSTLGALCPCLQKQTRPWPLGKSALSRPCLLPQFHPLLPHSQPTPVVLAPKIFFMVLFSSASPLGLPLWWPQTSFYHLIWGMTEHVSSSNHIMANQIWDSFGRPALNVGHEASWASLGSEYPFDVLQRMVAAAIWA